MKEANPSLPENIDQYISVQAPEYRKTLEELRSIIHQIVPDAEESISYMVPCFKHIYMLVGIGVNKDFYSLYVMNPPLVKAMKDELKGVKVSGATIHFPPGKPLPVALIKKIVKARVKQNEELAQARKAKKPAAKKLFKK